MTTRRDPLDGGEGDEGDFTDDDLDTGVLEAIRRRRRRQAQLQQSLGSPGGSLLERLKARKGGDRNGGKPGAPLL